MDTSDLQAKYGNKSSAQSRPETLNYRQHKLKVSIDHDYHNNSKSHLRSSKSQGSPYKKVISKSAMKSLKASKEFPYNDYDYKI